MSKLLIALHRMPDVFSTFYTSSNKHYLSFLKQFYSKEIDFGSMSDDKINYSKDFKLVYRDYKRASIVAREKIENR